MIKLCTNNSKFLDICDKLEEVKNPKLTQQILYNYMTVGLYTNEVCTYVSCENNIMNGCIVLWLTKDILGETTLGMVFTWIDAHYPNIYKEFIEIATDKARELGAKKISLTTNRSEKVIDRKLGKYGFTKSCSVYEKRIEEVI